MTELLAYDETVYEPHDGRHTDCPPCFQVKLRSINIQGPGAGDRRQTEHSRSMDMDAYQSARRQGLQPQHVFGSHEVMAQAGSKFEAEHHMIMAPAVRKEMEASMRDMPKPGES